MAEENKDKDKEKGKKETKDDKKINFAKLRKQKEKELAELQEELDSERKEKEEILKKQQEEKKSLKKSRIDKAVKKWSKGDEEVGAKMNFYLDSYFKEELEDEEKFDQIMEDAYTLAAGTRPKKKSVSDAISSDAGATPGTVIREGRLGEDALDVAKKLGITSKELKKNKLI